MPDGVPVEGTHETVPESIPSDTEMLDWVLRTGAQIHCPDGMNNRRYVIFDPCGESQPRSAPDGYTVREAVINGMKFEKEHIEKFDLPEPLPYLDPEEMEEVGQVMQQLPGEIPNPPANDGMKKIKDLAGIGQHVDEEAIQDIEDHHPKVAHHPLLCGHHGGASADPVREAVGGRHPTDP